MSSLLVSRNKKIRILHFIYALQGGGAERQLRNLLNSMDAQQFTNAICCADAKGAENFAERIEIFELPRKAKADLRWSSISQLVDQWKPDIIHNWLPLTLWSSLPIAQLKRIIYLGSYRNVYSINNASRFLQAVGFLFVDSIVSNVHEQEQLPPFRQIFRMKSGQFIPNGIDLKKIHAAELVELSQFGINPFLPVVLYAGRLSPHKNIQVLFEAIEQLKNQSIELQLLICGIGSDEVRLKQLVLAMGLEGQVKFLGYCASIYAIMRSCHAFVLPSLWEGMPNVLFEAMAANIPVIASDISVHRRWITDGVEGFLFNPKDSGQLANCLNQILIESVESRQERLEQASRCVATVSLHRMVSAYERLYANLLGR